MKISKHGTKLIKPHIPTPQNLKNYSISFVDKHLGATNMAVVLFYDSSEPANDSQLEESLAKTLVQFYPLAGRYIKNDHKIDCSDQGAGFVVAEALDVEQIDQVIKFDADKLNALLPDQYFRVDEAATDPLLSIQATRFPCRGLAVAISVSHRVFDMSSLATFIAAWSDATNKTTPSSTLFSPFFELPSLLPYKDHDFRVHNSKKSSNEDAAKIVVKSFLFNKVVLTDLKLKIMQNGNRKQISGTRVACAVIAQALIRVARATRGRNTDFLIFQPVNMRERTKVPLPRHVCGNLSFVSFTRRVAASEAADMGIEEIVDLIGDGVRKSILNHAEILSPDRDGRDIIISNLANWLIEASNTETNVIIFTDWSKFGFYEADFGWGKPVWTSIGLHPPRRNSTVLMSNKEGDGIEAWVHLKEGEMRRFEQDEDIKLLTT